MCVFYLYNSEMFIQSKPIDVDQIVNGRIKFKEKPNFNHFVCLRSTCTLYKREHLLVTLNLLILVTLIL